MKRVRRGLLFVLALLMLTVSPVLPSVTQEAMAAQTGWVNRGGKIYYFDAAGNMAVGHKIMERRSITSKRKVRLVLSEAVLRAGQASRAADCAIASTESSRKEASSTIIT